VIRRGYPGVADIPYETKSERQHRPAFHRRAALDLGHLVTTGPRTLLSAWLLPSIAATTIDGSADRLWQTPLATYLVQLAALAARAR
jgi:hypothetical protein